jgi:hypothetical protein
MEKVTQQSTRVSGINSEIIEMTITTNKTKSKYTCQKCGKVSLDKYKYEYLIRLFPKNVEWESPFLDLKESNIKIICHALLQYRR